MRIKLIIGLLLFMQIITSAQDRSVTELRNKYLTAKDDSVRQNACLELTNYYNEVNRDSALFYIEQRLEIAKKNNYKILEAYVLTNKAYQKTQIGKYAESFRCIMDALKIVQDSGNLEINHWRISQFPAPGNERWLIMSGALHQIGLLMRETENVDKEIEFFKKALSFAKKVNHIDRQMVSNMNLGSAYARKGMLDSAFYYGLQSDSIASLPDYKGIFKGRNLANIGDVYFRKGAYREAKNFYIRGLDLSAQKNNLFNVAVTKHKLIQLFLKVGESDSALYYAKDILNLVQEIRNGTNFQLNLGYAYEDIFLAYQQKNNRDSTYKYLNLAFHLKDSLYKVRIANLSAFQNVSFEETLRVENLEKERIQNAARLRIYLLITGLIIFSLIVAILYRNNLTRKKSNLILKKQKEEIELQKKQVEDAMEQLKSTQTQLVQSEKMASLGELTAGIAHEIQNPLNFVNNFSEVSNELIDEMKEELATGNLQQVTAIADDLKENLNKINHHGKRADSIVKGMLQHSRTNTGQKELTDVNALCDEYLRLAYHGYRAKDKSFNAQFETDFDQSLPKLQIMPQDFGRVILNLINNAFYAVNERQKAERLTPNADNYKPTVTIDTKKMDGKVEIHVRDNGTGIPKEVVDKIFQPFFTTKPTGQGTGLGLSLSYDIITKGHSGELRVITEAGTGTKFQIILPIHKS